LAGLNTQLLSHFRGTDVALHFHAEMLKYEGVATGSAFVVGLAAKVKKAQAILAATGGGRDNASWPSP
jgi:hypothetical protein